MNKQKILDFIKSKRLAVVSTINSKGTSESAVVAFSETEKLELIFATFNTTRKYKNLQLNKHVSVVIGWDEGENITVQYEGIAEELTGEELEQGKKSRIAKNPSSKIYDADKGQRHFKIKPKWIRYSNLGKEPEIFEIIID